MAKTKNYTRGCRFLFDPKPISPGYKDDWKGELVPTTSEIERRIVMTNLSQLWFGFISRWNNEIAPVLEKALGLSSMSPNAERKSTNAAAVFLESVNDALLDLISNEDVVNHYQVEAAERVMAHFDSVNETVGDLKARVADISGKLQGINARTGPGSKMDAGLIELGQTSKIVNELDGDVDELKRRVDQLESHLEGGDLDKTSES